MVELNKSRVLEVIQNVPLSENTLCLTVLQTKVKAGSAYANYELLDHLFKGVVFSLELCKIDFRVGACP